MASSGSNADQAPRRTLLCRAGGAVYGCDLETVREIVPYRRATRLPGAPPFVHGLINLRGTLVTVLDLGARLDEGRRPVSDGSIVLVGHGARTVGLAVEEVLDVRPIALDPGAAVADAAAGVVRGLGRSDETVVVLLDIQTLLQQVLLS